MTMPRRIIPGKTYLLSRRCTQREFRLSPAGKVPLLFAYALALIAERYGVEVHIAVCMGNHYHLVLTDRLGRIPDFARDFHSITARAINSMQGEWEAMWSSGRVSLVELVDVGDLWRKLIYVLANPVEAGLVHRLSDWPGFATRPIEHERAPKVFRRPKIPFLRRSTMAPEATLRLTVPTMLGEMTPKAFARELRERLAIREAEIRAVRKVEGRRIAGARRVANQPPTSRPRSKALRRGLDPAIAAKDAPKRVAALRALRVFRDLYRRALELWRKHLHPVVFPYGTFKMRNHPGVLIAAPPPQAFAA